MKTPRRAVRWQRAILLGLIIGAVAGLAWRWSQAPIRVSVPGLGTSDAQTPSHFLDGKVVDLSGNVVVLRDLLRRSPRGLIINFWATWCPPCIEELPSLEQLAREASKKTDVYPEVIAVSVDDRIDDIQRFLKTLPFRTSFKIFHDPGALVSQAIGTTRFPETYWIAPTGQIQFKWTGPQSWMEPSLLSTLERPLNK